MTDVAAADLYERLSGPVPPRILDVRNADEFARWRVEGPRPVDVLNVPYFEFVEHEDASVEKVTKASTSYELVKQEEGQDEQGRKTFVHLVRRKA